ncbi:Uncharacterised protein [uncultured archaeon]|nr:Uncharacterised protein [uncultured archaeon]
MITGIRIDKVEAWREKMTEMKGLDINISVDNVNITGPEVQVEFTYVATYPDKAGILSLKGRAADEAQKLLMSYMAETGLLNGRLPASVKVERWDVGAATLEVELSFVGHPSSPVVGKGAAIRFKTGLVGDEQHKLAMELKEQLAAAKNDASKVLTVRNAALTGADALLDLAPAPVGVLRMRGSLLSHEEAKQAKEISAGWAADRKLPDAFSELVLNAINFTCGTNGVLVVRPVNLAPPMVPPRISLGNANQQ